MTDLKSYFHNKYQGGEDFIQNVIIPIFGEDKYEDAYDEDVLENNPELITMAQSTGVTAIHRLGTINIPMNPTYVFDITVSDHVQMKRNRVAVQLLVRRIMSTFSSAFMVFHYDDDDKWDWRFTFCSKQGTNGETTDSKRYTFLLGPNQSCRTAADNFKKLAAKGGDIELEDIVKAFDVEALSAEFFQKYKEQYEKFVMYITGKKYVKTNKGWEEKEFHEPHPQMYADFGCDDKRVRNYIKKLLGRIVFLYFLQKKGWLGATDEQWTNGPQNFMSILFNNATTEQKENFLDVILEPLYECLDTPLDKRSSFYDTHVEGLHSVHIPFLGGLFERTKEDCVTSQFPQNYFAELFKFLDEYNFTIDENDPNDAQVGVDPEMLGRIFENLLEDNKDKGAFYTPKEIVQYMCRESLIAYLQTDQREEDKERIRKFVKTHDAELLGDLKENIDQKLINVKICDPAIGSGAFPMGLLRELFFCRSAIEPNIVENAANIKRHIIQNNIYGVDIERGAVDIARMRFWLSLIVDENSPVALPNLDFKIMQGNSLLEQYKGVDLSTMTEKKVGVGKALTFFDGMLDVYRKNLRDKLAEYYNCQEHAKKLQLRKDIADIVKQELDEQGIRIDFEDMDLSANSQFFLWHTWFHDVFSRPSKEGFDIVIGNPPYISAPAQIASPKLKEQRQRIVASKKYRSLNEKWDLYVPFMELGMQRLCPNGVFSMIIPYPLTNQKYGKKLRKMITEEYCLLEIVDLNGTKIFANATVSNCIPFIQNSKPGGELRITRIFEDKTIRKVFSKSPEALKQDERNYVWNLTEEERTGNRFANMNVLGDFCYISKGMVLNADETTAKGAFRKDDLISDSFDNIHSRKYIEAKDIDKFQIKRVRYLEWNTERCPNKLSRPTFRELYDCPKLLINRLGVLKVHIDENIHYLHSDSMFCAVLWKDLKGVYNKSISTSIKKFSKHNRADMESISGRVDLYYLLGILNSSMVESLLADQRGGDYHIYPEHIRNLPIPIPQKEVQDTIGIIAKEIILRREKNIDYSELEEQLNRLVKALYQ